MMPTYDYQCDHCGHRFEAFQSIKANPIETCPVCKSPVHRIINGGVGLIFKGSGFYITDYKHAHSSTGSGGNGSHGKPDTDSAPSAPVKSKETDSGKPDIPE